MLVLNPADPINITDLAFELQQDGFCECIFLSECSHQKFGIRITLNINHTEEIITNLLTTFQQRMNQRDMVTEENMKAFISKEKVMV